MLQLPELRIGNFIEIESINEDQKNKPGKVTEIAPKQVSVSGKWFELNRLRPIEITEDVLLHAGFKEFTWLKGFSIFESNYLNLKCKLNEDGANLFCDNIKNLPPVKHLHELQNLFYALTKEELEVDTDYIKSRKTEMA